VVIKMLRGIPKCLSPELLKVISEMGHGDRLIIADAYYPAASSARHSLLVRADGVRATELIEAILNFFPLDTSVEKPVLIMDKQECDRNIPTPIWDEYHAIVCRYDKRGSACIGKIGRFDFYKEAESAYAVLATGESSLYGCVILQKGTV
jgi:L-fucose mutarotase